MANPAMKWDAVSEIAPHSCNQTQSRHTVNVAVVANSATTARFSLCRAATVEDGAVVRKFRTTLPVCANFAHTACVNAFIGTEPFLAVIPAQAGIQRRAYARHKTPTIRNFRTVHFAEPSAAEKDSEKSLSKLEQIEITAKKKGGQK
jgi:hypothetical protein